jgi:single stranded DNA-binding protein
MNTISNYCRFIGRLTADPDLVELDNTELCRFTLAVSEYRKEKGPNGEYRKKKSVNYFDFEAWDSGATTLEKYCKKGDIVDVVTSARNNNWVDKEGNKKFQTRFRVKEFKLFNNKPNNYDNSEAASNENKLEKSESTNE